MSFKATKSDPDLSVLEVSTTGTSTTTSFSCDWSDDGVVDDEERKGLLLMTPTTSSSGKTSDTEDEFEEDYSESSRLQDRSKNTTTTMSSSNKNNDNAKLKSALLVLLVIQGSSSILTARYTRSSVPEEELYEISHLVVAIECMKLVISTIMEYVSSEGKLLESINEHVLKRPKDTLKVLVPAVMYVIQNSLIYIALSNLSAPVFISLQQGKLIATAMVSVTMLQRSYSFKQWFCLFTLAIGVAIVALDETWMKARAAANLNNNNEASEGVEDSEEATSGQQAEQYFAVGVMAVAGACFSSAFAGVYFEMMLAPEKAAKKPINTLPERNPSKTMTPAAQPPSLWLRNMQLAFFSVIFAYLQGVQELKDAIRVGKMLDDDDSDEDATTALLEDDDDIDPKPFFHGFTFWVWMLVGINAFGGLLIAAVMKYADNVLKGLAMGIVVVTASIISALLFDVQLSEVFVLGACIICASVYCFSNDISRFTAPCGNLWWRKRSTASTN